MFNLGKIIRDMVAKAMMVLGGSAAVTGIATTEQWTAITGGVVAIVGVVLQGFNKTKELKNIAAVAVAVETGKKPTQILKDPTATLVLPTDKKNFGSH